MYRRCSLKDLNVPLSLNSNVLFINFYILGFRFKLNLIWEKLKRFLLQIFFRSKDDSPESVDGPKFYIHDNGSLEIYSVEKDDAGLYTCLARNTEGSSAINAILNVKGKQFLHVIEVPHTYIGYLYSILIVIIFYTCERSYQNRRAPRGPTDLNRHHGPDVVPCSVRQVLQQWFWAPMGKGWYGDISKRHR